MGLMNDSRAREWFSKQPPEWIIEGVLPYAGYLTAIGPEETAKSGSELVKCQAIVAGTDWFGFPVRQKGPVVYVCPERTREQLKRHTRAFPEPLDGLFWWIQEKDDPPFFLYQPPPDFWRALEDISPLSVSFDTFGAVGGISKTGAPYVRANIERIQHMGIAVNLVHHPRKPPREGDTPLDAGYGDSGMFRGRDTLITHQASGDQFIVTIEKQSQSVDKVLPFSIRVVDGVLCRAGSQESDGIFVNMTKREARK